MVSLISFCLLFLYSTAFSDIYKYMDENGVLRLTNVPNNPKYEYVLIMKEKRIIKKESTTKEKKSLKDNGKDSPKYQSGAL